MRKKVSELEGNDTIRTENDLLSDINKLIKLGAWILDIKTGISTWTDEIYRIHDFPPDIERNIQNGLNCYHGIYREKIEKALQDTVEYGTPFDLELELISLKGIRKWVRVLGHAKLVDGRVAQIEGLVQEITEHKHIEENLKLTQFIFDNAPIGILRMGLNGDVIDVNEEGCRSLDYSLDELRRKKFFDIAPGFTTETWAEGVSSLREMGFRDVEAQQQRRNGEIFPVHVIEKLIQFEGVDYHIAFVQDISERKQIEDNLLLARSIIDKANIGIYTISLDGRILEVNQTAADILGYPKVELEALTIEDIDPEADNQSWPNIKELLGRERTQINERVHRRKDGTLVPVEVHGYLLNHRGMEYIITFVQNITERKNDEKRMARLATTDELTKLMNRRRFYELVEAEIQRSRRTGQPASYITYDVDHFKEINDTYGHIAGDLILITLAETVNSCLREIDYPARIGGDEFAVLLPETKLDKALLIAERLRLKTAEMKVNHDKNTLNITISLGVAQLKEHESLEDLSKRSDMALYKAKESGRNRVSCLE